MNSTERRVPQKPKNENQDDESFFPLDQHEPIALRSRVKRTFDNVDAQPLEPNAFADVNLDAEDENDQQQEQAA